MSHLDRLSALLEGLSPQIRIRTGALQASEAALAVPDCLELYLLLDGGWRFLCADGAEEHLIAPGLMVWRGALAPAPRLFPALGESRALCVEAVFAGPAASLLLDAFTQPLFIALDAHCAELDLIVRLIASEMAAPRWPAGAAGTCRGDFVHRSFTPFNCASSDAVRDAEWSG